MFHRTVLEIPSRNLDSFFADGDTLRYLLGREVLEMEKFPESRIAVLEGVMGFYDGLGGVSERSSGLGGGGSYGYAGDPSGGYEREKPFGFGIDKWIS